MMRVKKRMHARDGNKKLTSVSNDQHQFEGNLSERERERKREN